MSFGRNNYSLEVLNGLCQYNYELTSFQSQELIWNYFVNLRSAPWWNDLGEIYQEHLNQVCKEYIKELGANKMEKAISRVGKAHGNSTAPPWQLWQWQQCYWYIQSTEDTKLCKNIGISSFDLWSRASSLHLRVVDLTPLFPKQRCFVFHKENNTV